MPSDLYGIAAEFTEADTLLAATQAAWDAGWRHLDAYSPFPIEGLAEAVGMARSVIPALTLAGGLAGALGAFALQTYATTYSYPFNVGGRPLFSWISYIPVTFELTVLGAAFAATFGMLALNGLPRLHHPIFNANDFLRASTDRFFLCIKASDPNFDRQTILGFLAELRPEAISDVPQ